LIFLKVKNPAKELPVLCQLYDKNHQFFDENLEFFEVSETSGTNNSLILNFFQRTGIDDSLILKYFKNQN
jgi:hypothetical protein